MRKYIMILVLICAFFLPFAGRAQINYVINPSFEDYWRCSIRAGNIKFAKYWSPISDTVFSATDTLAFHCTPEYCNTCARYGDASVPLNVGFNHYPRTGNGMTVVYTYYKESFDTTNRERRSYLQGRLRQNLIAGNKYSVFFYISLTQTSAYANNNIGAYLDDGTIDTTTQCGMPQTTHHPQVNDTSIYTDTLHWKKIEGTFTANGTEKFITIGNFFDGAHTDTIYTNYWNTGVIWWGLYLVDDVGVIDCSNIPYAGHDTMIHPGDSAFIGPHEGLLPYTWYIKDSSTAIDSGGGMWVKPTVTTTYILKQVLCGVTKYDTVVVNVWPVSVAPPRPSPIGRVMLYPNPVISAITIEGAANCSIDFFNLVGQKVASFVPMTDKEVLDISKLPKGVYTVRVMDKTTGEKLISKIVKE